MNRLAAILYILMAALITSIAMAEETQPSTLHTLLGAGCVDVQELDPEIRVDLMYAGPDNFTGTVLYQGLDRAMLHPDAARALAAASARLRAEHPHLRLLVKDAARPLSVQRHMYNVVRGTSKARYVANPDRGPGLHNYGIAVDVTIVDTLGRELDMGTPVDHLGPEAHIDTEEALVRRGIITPQAMSNRRLLRGVMTAAGFHSLRTEWWHFQLMGRRAAAARYTPIR